MGILQITEKITPIPITQCKIKHIDETLHEEIIADSEKPYPLASHVSIEAEDITFGDDETKENNSEDILDILYGDDDEEDEKMMKRMKMKKMMVLVVDHQKKKMMKKKQIE